MKKITFSILTLLIITTMVKTQVQQDTKEINRIYKKLPSGNWTQEEEKTLNTFEKYEKILNIKWSK